MAKGTIGGKIVLEGESQYRAALKNIKLEQTELRSEMRLCQSTFKESQNSLEALQTKYEVLTKQIDSQTRKVEVYEQAMLASSKKEEDAAEKVAELQQALDKAQREMQEMESCTGATSEALENQAKTVVELKEKLSSAEYDYEKVSQKTIGYKTSVNNANAELEEMRKELSNTEKYMEEAAENAESCATSINNYGKATKNATEETLGFGDVLKATLLSDVITTGVQKLGELAQKTGEELINCAVGAAQYADDIATTATNTGIAAETLQELTYAQELMDVSLDTLTGTMAKNIKSMDSARKGSADYVEAYEKLGVAITDDNDKMRDSEIVFWEVVDALGKMENATERDTTAMQLFGKKAQDINSLIAIGSDGFNKLAAEAHETGFVLSDDVLNGLLDTSDAMERMNNRIANVKNRIGGELAPVFTRSFDKIGNAVDDAGDIIIDIADDAIPKLVAGMEWCIENADVVAAGIGGITTAVAYHVAVGPAIAAVTKAWNAYKASTEGATVSQWLLNTAMNANPAGLLVAAIVGLSAAVATYSVINKDNLFATNEVNIATREQVKVAKELNAEYATATAERTSARKELETEAVSCKNLVAELKELEAKQKLSNAEQARMDLIIEQLNQAMPRLNLAIDEQTGKLNMSTQALESNVEAMMAMARAEAAREDLVRIAEDQYEAEKQLSELQGQLAEQKKVVADAQEQANESMKEAQELYGDQIELAGTMGAAETNALIQAQEAQKELEEQIAATTETINGFTTEYEETMAYISDTEALASASAATAELGDAAEGAQSQVITLSESAREAYEEMRESLHETISGQISLFSEFSSQAEMSTEEILKNMQSQVEGITSWSDNLAALAEKGIDQGLLQHLANMGPEGAGYVAAFVKMTDEELQKANELFTQSLSIPSEAVDKVSEAYLTAGENAGKKFQTGITNSKEPVATSAKELAQSALSATEEALDINSPSGETETIGTQFDAGLEKGISEGKPKIIDTVEDLTADIVNTAKDNLQTTVFEEIGKQITVGIQNGILAGKSGVLEAIKQMCAEIITSTNTELDINSPSKKAYWSGEMYGTGFIEGYRDSMNNIGNVVRASLPDESMMKYPENATLNGTTSNESESVLVDILEEMNAGYIEAITDAINNGLASIKVVLEGEAKGVFKMVKIENDKMIKATGYNHLAKKEV